MFFSLFFQYIFTLIGYIGGINVFPKALSRKEETELLEKYSNGDLNAKNTLIEHNLRLVAHVAKKYSAGGKLNDDYISIGTIGLIKGMNSFKVGKGTKLSTYLARCIENEILMHIRSTKKQQSEVSLEDPIGFDFEGNTITFNDILATDDNITELVGGRVDMIKLYKTIKGELDFREKQVVILRYGLCGYKEHTQKEVAQKLNISRSYVSRIEKKAIEKLSAVMNKKDNIL